jgi:hypothetical protein
LPPAFSLPFSLTKLSLIIYIRKYLNGLPFWHTIAKGDINIPPFAMLIKRINIASFCIRQARQIEEEEEMCFIKRNQQYKTSGMQPIRWCPSSSNWTTRTRQHSSPLP